MNKKDYFEEVLEKVAELAEIPLEKVMKSNQEECVDARHLAVAVLSERFSDRQIAELSGWSFQMVNKARNNFSDRCKFRWGLKEMYKETLFCFNSK